MWFICGFGGTCTVKFMDKFMDSLPKGCPVMVFGLVDGSARSSAIR